MEWLTPSVLLTPSVILLTGGIAARIALRSIEAHEKITKKRASIDLLITIQQDTEFGIANEFVTTFKHKYEEKYIPNNERERLSYEAEKEYFERSLKYMLNQYEYMAVGIKQGIYDVEILKQAQYTPVIRLWYISQSAIIKFRSLYNSKTIYKDLKELVEKWEANPLQVNQQPSNSNGKIKQTISALKYIWCKH